MKNPAHVVILCALAIASSSAQDRLLDSFETIEGWSPIASDGATLRLVSVPGVQGNALGLDFSFAGGSSYVIAQKRFNFDLSHNYSFSFFLRGETPANNFEFKLLDTAGNVYWIKKLNVEYPTDWERTTIKRRHITFAWGPAGGGEITHVDRIEFVVSAGSGGGSGRVFIDEFSFRILESNTAAPKIKRVAVSPFPHPPRISADGSAAVNWRTDTSSGPHWILLDFGSVREFGGFDLEWGKRNFARAYQVELSNDSLSWNRVYSVAGANGGRDYIPLPEAEARFARVRLLESSRGQGFELQSLRVRRAEFSDTPNSLFTAIAMDARRGRFPKYFLKEQSYWTVVGASGDTKEALLNAEGTVEVDKAAFSLEPFLRVDGRLITWADVRLTQGLDSGYLPIPFVDWGGGAFRLRTTAFAGGEAGSSRLFVKYTLRNEGRQTRRASLFVTVRPFQVNPPWQSLNTTGGVGAVHRLAYQDGVVRVRSGGMQKAIVPLRVPDGFGAASFDAGDVLEYIAQGRLPSATGAEDSRGWASGAFRYDLTVSAGDSVSVAFMVPFHSTLSSLEEAYGGADPARLLDDGLRVTRAFWHSKLDRLSIRLPESGRRVESTVKSNLAYILINRDGPAIQPGSRTYERAWMRDGSLTSTALLQTGNPQEVREYLDWYAPFQFPNGKVPCVVDIRGADPVPENDSHGELIYAIGQYFRFTRDTAWLRQKLPSVVRTVRYIQELRSQRKTEPYRTGTPEQRACYGLVPESISHEGYSAKPMHSYWDDFFVLRGLKDATFIAQALKDTALAREFCAERDDFRRDLYASMSLAMSEKNISYIPGCVELGDFDATSTAIGVSPGGEIGHLPERQLQATFDRYFEFFQRRRDGVLPWENYTPYEVRLIGTFVYLDQKERVHQLLDFFLRDQRPQGWNQWAEVVWRDPKTPRMIGDMPHTWVGSDFIRSIISMFVYEREIDEALVVGAGIPAAWVPGKESLRVENLPTGYGPLTYSMRRLGGSVEVDLSGSLTIPPGGIEVRSPLDVPPREAVVDGSSAALTKKGGVLVHRTPVRVLFNH
jgi:hypothetical protein